MADRNNEIVWEVGPFAFTHADLDEAFERVRVPMLPWKAPIDRVLVDVTLADKVVIDAACRYFAGCPARFTPVGSASVLTRVKAAGYWEAVGA